MCLELSKDIDLTDTIMQSLSKIKLKQISLDEFQVSFELRWVLSKAAYK